MHTITYCIFDRLALTTTVKNGRSNYVLGPDGHCMAGSNFPPISFPPPLESNKVYAASTYSLALVNRN